MTVEEAAGPGRTSPPLPTSIWVVAWASLAGQAVPLLERGGRLGDPESVLGSVVLGALVVGYVAAGVVRARTLRTVLARLVLALSLLTELVGLATVDDLGEGALLVLALTATAVSLAGLERFRRSDWYAWQCTDPPSHVGARIGRLVAIGVLVGVLGGLAGPADDGIDVHVRVAER
ncbi:hypothetical protein AB0N29_09565 [Nocardioides sp. NPDC092400]|uniref:hypothetical protein n=1 Tax=Nocardioides sp. NPDC092400 TaxID=3155196 RepID=UPI00341C702A